MDSIFTDKAPAPIGPYSQAIRCDRLLFISGQINPVPGDFRSEAKGVLENIKAICEAANCSLRDVAKVTVFLADMNDWPLFNEVYAIYFNDHKPARSAVAVAGLPKNARIEVEAICNLPHAGDFIFD